MHCDPDYSLHAVSHAALYARHCGAACDPQPVLKFKQCHPALQYRTAMSIGTLVAQRQTSLVGTDL